jgi:serine/threonine-protein kinase
MRRAGVSADKAAFIIMDLLQGKTLRELLNKFRFGLVNALHVMKQVARAMQFAHSQGIVHRDLKPENLMIGTQHGEKGHVWVLDFGIAKMTAGGVDTDELPNVGTALYMAPEQARWILRPSKSGPRVKPDHRVDIYAFWAIFYEMLTGQHILQRTTTGPQSKPTTTGPRSFEETLAGHLSVEPEPIYVRAPDCPVAVWEMTKRGLAIDPDARHQTFDEVVEELSKLVRELIVSERVPKEHLLSRQVEQEETRAAQQAAFEAIATAVEAEEAAEAAAAAEVEREAGRTLRASGTAPLRDFVSKDSLPFSIKAPVPVPVGRGRGFTVQIPKAAGEEAAAGGEAAGGEAAPSSAATLPVGRGRGFTVRIPTTALPPPRAEGEVGAAKAPAGRAVTESSSSRTTAPPRMRTEIWVLASLTGLGALLSGASLVISLRAHPQVSPAVSVAVSSAPQSAPPAQAPVAPAISGGASASTSSLPAPVPSASVEPGASASARTAAAQVEPTLPAVSAGEETGPAVASAPAKSSPTPSTKPSSKPAIPSKSKAPKRAATAAPAPPGPLIDFDHEPSQKPKGRR